ncbi:hypothetical protein NSK_004639 [Nannochloropsis salina CCMP1776]|uniref:Enoyl reductase (ER) domain-containing protein n=1 Tax=Nannochloropsis salina CCMP1776 TaxID=1027361 RepID=A0A4D9D1D3_9STRA|nr:hypothetical protein NSK_004639 [Nannochloropsis salina CCMP1776]|eukprot:TFJ84167.1 hypothetical protein NSK_004639 [Nannochloropsis salina CCMP1776]
MRRGMRPRHGPFLLFLLAMALRYKPCSSSLASHLVATAPLSMRSQQSFASSVSSNVSQAPSLRAQPSPESLPSVLLLDVDGTLYSKSTGVEDAIAANIKKYCNVTFQISPNACDALHHQYGSTIQGLKMSRNLSDDDIAAFYNTAYQNLPLHRLLPPPRTSSLDADVFGYQHRLPLAALLHAHRGPVWIVSNSPRAHVQRVLAHIGLASFPWAGMLTPDSLPGYPTKTDPSFYVPILHRYRSPPPSALPSAPPSALPSAPPSLRLVLLDDSPVNLRAAQALGIRGIKVQNEGGKEGGEEDSFPLDRALAAAMDAIDPSWRFDEVEYLRAKNRADARSFHPGTLSRLQEELKALRHDLFSSSSSSSLPPSLPPSPPLRVLDMGAGLLSMLSPVLQAAKAAGFSAVEYQAYELNAEVFRAARRKLLEEEGFQMASTGGDEGGGEVVLVHEGGGRGNEEEGSVSVRVTMRVEDAGAVVLRASGGGGEGGRERGREGGRLLVYLPITFAGQTALVPPAPAQDLRPPPSPFPASSLPSDAMAMEAYHHSLSHIQRHNLSPERLVHAMASHGAALIARGESPWRVEPDRDAYLWRCLAHFFGLGLLTTSAAFSSQGRGGGKGWDVGAWRRRLMERAPRIEVGNVDLLFRWGGGGGGRRGGREGGRKGGKGGEGGRRHVFVEFAGPRDVRCREEIWREKPALGSEEVEVDALCSLISSGTELKVYRGEIPQGEEAGEVDVNIKGMAGETLAYPLRYGYALVGRVVRCGADVADRERLMGREGGGEGAAPLVFAFSPHASRAVVAASSLLVVPPGILAEDAVYFPSVETALSLVQDARPLAGERVTVVGAGLIGLLVLAVLKRFPLGSLRAVDPLMVRRHLARRMGASVAVDPGMLRTGKKKEGAGDEGGGGMEEGGDRREAGGGEEGAWEEDGVHEADTSIEVSGVAAGLQTAIDQTGYGGKVVIGSWYGNHETPAALRLGLAFHRSHLRLYVSQVSRISTELQDRWTKARRYQTAWRLLKEIRPSTTLTSRVVAPEQVKEAFHALDTQPAETLAVMIDYRMKEGKARNKGAGDK